MLKILVFLTKREGIETQAFIEYYQKNLVPLICDLAPTPIVYKRNFLMRGDQINKEDDVIDFDVVTELVFPDRTAYLAWTAQLQARLRRAGRGRRAEVSRLVADQGLCSRGMHDIRVSYAMVVLDCFRSMRAASSRLPRGPEPCL